MLGVLEAFVVAWEPLGGRWGDVIPLALLVLLAARRAMTDLAFDLYLLAAALGLVPAVAYAGMPVLAQSAFLALGAVGAMQLERAGLRDRQRGAAGRARRSGGRRAAGRAARPAPSAARVALATWGLAWLATTALLAFPELSGGTQGLTRPALDRVETYLGALAHAHADRARRARR